MYVVITWTIQKSFQKQWSNWIFVEHGAKLIKKKNIPAGTKKENLLLTHRHFYPVTEEAQIFARTFSAYLENFKSKNGTRELATNAIIGYNFFLKASSVDHAGNNHICNSRKQLPVHKLPL